MKTTPGPSVRSIPGMGGSGAFLNGGSLPQEEVSAIHAS